MAHPVPTLLALLPLLLLGSCASNAVSETSDSPGSTRGSVAAIEASDLPEELLYLASGLDEEQLAELQKLAPNLRVVSGLDKVSALELADQAHGIDAHLLTPEILGAASNLRWVQSWSAGVESYLTIAELRESESIVMTNGRGTSGPAIAEHVFAMLFQLSRGLQHYRAEQLERRWTRGAGGEMFALSGRTLLVAGMGGIGSEIARRGHGLDMRVLATVRTAREAPQYVDELRTGDALDELLPRADVVAIALPLTDETEGLFSASKLALMKPGAILINIGRGKIVQTDALVAALESGALGGACLDVTEPEPLPADHPLWGFDNVVITPHVASRSALTSERHWDLLRENFRRFAVGEPLLNVVDRQLGY